MEEVFYMTKNLIVRGAPQEYEIKENAWDSLPEHLYKKAYRQRFDPPWKNILESSKRCFSRFINNKNF